ncbi:caspase family protein [Streptomyces sp. NPDC051921]|uniref:caspase family protein n=1 Tax=Streptomyces sp. NPDC051921 TaxID=3155806 RepID=UPI003435333C
MPDGLSGPMSELMVRLHELHALAGWPSTREMAKPLPCSHFTIHQMFTRPELPRSTVYADVVALLARLNPWGDEDEICDRMSKLWLAAYHYVALGPEPVIRRTSSGRRSTDQESVAHAADRHAADRHAADRQAADRPAAGAQAAGAQAAGVRAAGARTTDTLAASAHATSARTARAHTTSAHATNAQAVPRQSDLPGPVLSRDLAQRHPDLPYLNGSRAVIVGAGRYRDADLTDLPTVAPGAEALHTLLTTDAPAFLPDATVAVMNGTRDDVLSAVHEAAEEATDTFLLYYAGHGLLTSSGALTLAAADTAYGRPYSAIPYDEVRTMFAKSPARRKAVILDCCFAGRAMAMGTAAELAAATGTYVLASASADRAALAPPDKDHPVFTGTLIDILERGVEGGPAVLDLQTVFDSLSERMKIQGSPRPQMMAQGKVRLALGPNHALHD